MQAKSKNESTSFCIQTFSRSNLKSFHDGKESRNSFLFRQSNVQNTIKVIEAKKKKEKKISQNEGTQIFNRTVSIKEIGIVQKCLMNSKSKSLGQSWNVNERTEAEDNPND